MPRIFLSISPILVKKKSKPTISNHWLLPTALKPAENDKKGKKIIGSRGKLAKQASKAHVEMCSKAMQMMDNIQNMLDK